jgi:hypothetical protein
MLCARDNFTSLCYNLSVVQTAVRLCNIYCNFMWLTFNNIQVNVQACLSAVVYDYRDVVLKHYICLYDKQWQNRRKQNAQLVLACAMDTISNVIHKVSASAIRLR